MPTSTIAQSIGWGPGHIQKLRNWGVAALILASANVMGNEVPEQECSAIFSAIKQWSGALVVVPDDAEAAE